MQNWYIYQHASSVITGVGIDMDLQGMDIHAFVNEFMHLSLSKVSQ